MPVATHKQTFAHPLSISNTCILQPCCALPPNTTRLLLLARKELSWFFQETPCGVTRARGPEESHLLQPSQCLWLDTAAKMQTIKTGYHV